MTNLAEPGNSAACEVCGQPAPAGHRICDECWPDRAVDVGRAGRCVVCGRPRLSEKLAQNKDGEPVCLEHLTELEKSLEKE